MKLRRPCQHGDYDEHVVMLGTTGLPVGTITRVMVCPGGEFLPEDAIVIENIDAALAALHATLERGTGDRFQERFVRSLLNALADQVGEPG